MIEDINGVNVDDSSLYNITYIDDKDQSDQIYDVTLKLVENDFNYENNIVYIMNNYDQAYIYEYGIYIKNQEQVDIQ